MKASPTVALQLLTMPYVPMTFAPASRTAPRCASVPVAVTTVQVMTLHPSPEEAGGFSEDVTSLSEFNTYTRGRPPAMTRAAVAQVYPGRPATCS
jgi:hypothetical protein